MSVDQQASVFKAYDIRGFSPEIIDSAFAERLGRVLGKKYAPQRVLVGRDMRSTSEDLERALVDGLMSQGVSVTRIGLCSTPVFNVSVGLGDGAYDLGVMVTASHNPSEYNGFKIVTGDVLPVGQGSGMEEIRDLFISAETFPDVAARGVSEQLPDAIAAYMDRITTGYDLASLPACKIAVDAGNGMNGIVVPVLAERLPQVTMLPLYWNPDGTFPNHEANPLKTETLKDLSALVCKESCAFGVAFDGDGDRVGFVGENGEQIPGDILTALFAEPMLERAPGAVIGYDLRSSWSTVDRIRELGGVPMETRVGHAFIKRALRERAGVFAGELSMHFYFGDLWSVESSDRCVLLLIQLIAKHQKPLSQIWKPLFRFSKTEELNYKGLDSESTMNRIRAHYESYASRASNMDGIKMEFGVDDSGQRSEDAWWFSLRASNTEPLLRLIIEAVTPELRVAKQKEIEALMKGSD